MGLMETQALLARLFTDGRMRRAFFDDPRKTALGFGLSESDAETLSALDRREVENFAASLLGKRGLDARKLVPLTAKALGAGFNALLYEAIDGSPVPGRQRADAASLVTLLAGRPIDPPWIPDLARYEMAFVAAGRPGPVLILRRFAYPVDDIARQLLAGARPSVGPARRVGIWLRPPRCRMFWRLF